MDIIKVKKLTKKFGSITAVDNISFEIIKGEIFGLLGPNGAGKTTTIRILTGVINPTSGSAEINNYDIQKNPIKAKESLGIVPETTNAYLDLSAYKNLTFIAELYGMTKEKRDKKALELLDLFELKEKKDLKVKAFSKGMKQRLILAMAMINDADILFLDEPTSGLDVKSARVIKNLIKKLNAEGKTILLTTHDIDDANKLCDKIAIMNYGKIVAVDSPEKLKSTIESVSSVEVAFEKPLSPDKFKSKNVSKSEKVGDKIKFYTKDPGKVVFELVDYSRNSDNKIVSLNTLKPDLEDVFIKLTEGKI